MLRKYILLFIFFIQFFFFIPCAHAQTLPSEPRAVTDIFVKGQVVQVVKEEMQQIGGFQTFTQTLNVRLLDGPQQGKTVIIQRGSDARIALAQKVTTGDIVVIDVQQQQGEAAQYIITDIYRLNTLWYVIGFFLLITIGFAGKKGVGAIVGLLVSFAIIMFFMIPQIVHGADPLLTSILASCAILTTTTYLAHGFSRQTTIAVISTFVALGITYFFAQVAVNVAHLAGLGTEDSYLLELNPNLQINPKGLLLGGILIGTLGALNDITTTQVAALFALFKQNPKINVWILAEQGFFIGREHIVSLVNTLVLAYAGASLPIFIFFILNPSHLPVWVIVNNESVAEEIIRTVTGSFGLVLAIPITTFLASWYIARQGQLDERR